MKELHIIDTLWLGGAQALLKYYFEYQKDNKEIFLLALRKRAGNITIDHANAHTLNYRRKYAFGRIGTLRKFIIEHSIEIVHCHLPNSLYHGIKIRKRINRIRHLVFHDHGVIYDSPWILKKMIKKNLQYIDRIACCSNDSIKQYRQFINEDDKIKFLPNGIDIERYMEEKSFEAENNEIVLGFAGRFVERKGWKDVLYTMATLKKEKEKIFKLLVAGDGPDYIALQKMIFNLKLGTSVKLIGIVTNMREFYKKIDILCVPSLWEGMPLTILEAMTEKIPIIAYDSHGINEIIKDGYNGFLIATGEYESMALKVKQLVQNPDLIKRVTENAQKDVHKLSILNYSKVLKEIIG